MFKYLQKHLHIPKWLFVLLAAVLLLRIPTLFEPYSYGDEMIYLTLGEGARQGLTLYKDIHDNKPPLLYFTAAIAGSLFWFKAILALWHIITIFLFWKLTEKFFEKSPKARFIATTLFAILTTIPLFEGNIANAEVFMLGFTILSFLYLLRENARKTDFFIGGVFLSIAGLYKIPALFDVFAVLIFFAYQVKSLKINQLLPKFKNFAIFGVGVFTPFVLVIIWYFSKGALNEYVSAALMQNVGYLSTWRPDDAQKSFIERNGPLLLRFTLLAVGLLILFIKRSKLTLSFTFASAWLLSSVFATTLSERPYPHYMIQVVPGIVLMISYFFTNKTKLHVYALIPLLVAVAAPFYYKFWYYPTVSYYKSFILFATGNYSKDEYFDTFNKNINRNYKVARYLNQYTNRNDKIFVWEDSPTLYALTRKLPPIKYVAGYHINEFSDKEVLVNQMLEDLPSYIIVMPEAGSFDGLEYILEKNYALASQIDGANVWKKIIY